MKIESIRMVHDGRQYIWDGRSWYDAKTWMTPPAEVLCKLNDTVSHRLEADDAGVTNVRELMKRLKQARDASQLVRADKLAMRGLELAPRCEPMVASVCGFLRERHRPEEVTRLTAPFAKSENLPLLTCRAAALCDTGAWEQALSVIRRVLALSSTKKADASHALGVRKRIEAARPDLF